MRNALRSDPFKLKVDGSNYMLVKKSPKVAKVIVLDQDYIFIFYT